MCNSTHKNLLKQAMVHAMLFAFLCLSAVAQTLAQSQENKVFDDLPSVSDKELEKASEIPDGPTPPPSPPMPPITPLQPLPVIPYVITPAAPQQGSQAISPDIEILLEEPPLGGDKPKDPKPNSDSHAEDQAPSEATAPKQPSKTLSEEAAEMPEGLPDIPPPPPGLAVGKTGRFVLPPESWSKSIMFTPEETRRLTQAISLYERRLGRKTISAPGVVTRRDVASAGRIPSFYLGSIAYVSPKLWTVWLNNEKYTHDKTEGEVRVLSVFSDKVSLTWSMDSLDIIVPDWRNKLTINDQGDYESSDSLVRVNNAGTEVTFTLRPNQSFVSNQMKVVEGRAADKLL